MKFRLAHHFSSAAMIALTATALAADTVELKPRWILGKTYFQTAKTEQTTSMNFGGQKMDQSTATTMEMKMTVRPHEDGKRKRLNLSYARWALDMNMNGQKISYDSTKPDAPDPMGLGKMLSGITSKETKLILNEKDEVTEIENYDELMAGMAGNPMAAMFSQAFSKEAMTQIIRQGSLFATPPGPVKAGAKWPYKFAMDMPQIGKVSMTGNYTLKSVGPHNGVQCAEIVSDGKMAMDLSGFAAGDPQAQAAVKGMKIEGGALNGTIWFDPALGMAREVQLNQDMTMTMPNPVNAQEKLTVPVKQKITQTLTKVEDAK